MKNKLLISLGIILVIVAASCLIYACVVLHTKEVEETNHLIELTFDELMEKSERKEDFILVFTQTTCSHCAEYKPVLKEVLNKYDIVAYEIAIDKLTDEQRAKLTSIANVTTTPVTAFIEDGVEGNISNRLNGGNVSESKIISRFKALGYIKELKTLMRVFFIYKCIFRIYNNLNFGGI